MSTSVAPVVAVVMGSRSDWETMQNAVTRLEQLGVPCEVQVVSAHRTPDLLFSFAEGAAARGIRVIIAGAAGAANAGLFAASILALENPAIAAALAGFRDKQTQDVLDQPDPRPA